MEELYNWLPEDELVIAPILESLSKRSGRNQTIDRLMNRWNRFITHIEEGYKLTIYDYTNDLAIRNFLQEIEDQCPQNILRKLLIPIETLDNRYIHVTKEIITPLLPPVENKKLGWWWYRIPINPGEELRNDLKTWGIY